MKKYDLILFGATGFTGQLVAEYLLRTYGRDQGLRWAIAGRSRDKLEAVRTELGDQKLEVVVADSKDRASLDAMTRQTRTICTTVGPYAKYGSDLVASCVAQQTNYCDLTGEVQWIRRMIDRHHADAERQQVKITHCCGFDSIPSDMGVYFLQKEAKARMGQYCQSVYFRLKGAKGGFSGGTVASLNHVLVEAQDDPSVYKILTDPYGLNPADRRPDYRERDFASVRHDDRFGAWIAPFIMGPINTKVVRRSHALRDFPYGEDFHYEEAMIAGKGLKGRVAAYAMGGGLKLITSAKPGSMVSKIFDRFTPDPGEGPSRAEREAGFFKIELLGVTRDGQELRATVSGDRDPGYGSTCKMLGESAVCLAMDQEALPNTYGVLTPSVSMGDVLLNRLQARAGLTFAVKS